MTLLEKYSRNFAKIEWLLIVLVLLYVVTPGVQVADTLSLIAATVGYFLCALGFFGIGRLQGESTWNLAVRSWLMIGLITIVLWHTGIILNVTLIVGWIGLSHSSHVKLSPLHPRYNLPHGKFEF